MILHVDTPCAAGARSTSFHAAATTGRQLSQRQKTSVRGKLAKRCRTRTDLEEHCFCPHLAKKKTPNGFLRRVPEPADTTSVRLITRTVPWIVAGRGGCAGTLVASGGPRGAPIQESRKSRKSWKILHFGDIFAPKPLKKIIIPADESARKSCQPRGGTYWTILDGPGGCPTLRLPLGGGETQEDRLWQDLGNLGNPCIASPNPGHPSTKIRGTRVRPGRSG